MTYYLIEVPYQIQIRGSATKKQISYTILSKSRSKRYHRLYQTRRVQKSAELIYRPLAESWIRDMLHSEYPTEQEVRNALFAEMI